LQYIKLIKLIELIELLKFVKCVKFVKIVKIVKIFIINYFIINIYNIMYSSYGSYGTYGKCDNSFNTSGYIQQPNSKFSNIFGESPYLTNNTNTHTHRHTRSEAYKSIHEDLYNPSEQINLSNKLNKFERSPLSDEYFSRENIYRIQKLIKKEINRKSNGNFTMTVDQNENNLLIVMNEIFEKYALNLPNKIRHQTKCLNKLLVSNIVPNMITEIKQQYKYIKEITTPIQPIARPININSGGRTTLPSFSTIW